ncbi:MAG: hypothetical protein U0269_22855 [Polyangiales bacterium]
MRAALFTLIAFALVCAPRFATAQRSPRAALQLSVERSRDAIDCADAARSQALVSARLGYDPVQSSAATRARVRWSRAGRRFVVTIAIERPGRARPALRTLSSRARTCEPLGDAMSLALAIAIDPVAAAEIAALPSEARPRVSLVRAMDAPRAIESAAAKAPLAMVFSSSVSEVTSVFARPSLRWFATARVGLGAPSAVPTVALGAVAMSGELSLGFGVGARDWSARLEVSGSLPARVRPSSATPVDLWNVAFTALGCGHPRAWLALCGASSATITGGSSAELQLVAGSVAPGLALGGRVAVEPRLGASPLSLSIALDGLGWIVAPALRLDGQALWSRPRFTAALSAGINLHFR